MLMIIMSILQAPPSHSHIQQGQGRREQRAPGLAPAAKRSSSSNSGFLGDRRRKVYFLGHLPQIAHRRGMIGFPVQPLEERLTQNTELTPGVGLAMLILTGTY